MSSRKQIVLAAGIIGLLAWVTWPADGQLNASICAPDGFVAKVSAALHGNAFWRAQLAALEAERRLAETWEDIQAEFKARMERILEKADEKLDSLVATHPERARTDADTRAKKLRRAAEPKERDRAVREFMTTRTRVLAQCEERIKTVMRRP